MLTRFHNQYYLKTFTFQCTNVQLLCDENIQNHKFHFFNVKLLGRFKGYLQKDVICASVRICDNSYCTKFHTSILSLLGKGWQPAEHELIMCPVSMQSKQCLMIACRLHPTLSIMKWVEVMRIVGNLWISEAPLSKLEKFRNRSVFPSIQYISLL